MVTVVQFEEWDRIVPAIPHSTMPAANSPLRYVHTYVGLPSLFYSFSLIYCLRVPLTYSSMYNPHPLLYNIVLVEY